jgi:competence protein ComEC
MYSGIAYLLLAWVPWLSTTLAWVLEKSILLMNKALSIIEHAPFASINKIWFTTAEYLLTYTLIISLFYFLYDKKSWLLKLSMACLFLLCLSISIKRYHADNSSSVAFLNLRKNTGIIFKSGDKAVVLTNLADTDKNYKYAVQPYLDSCKISHAELYTLNQGISKSYLKKQGGFIQFNNKKIMVFDKQILSLQLPQKLKTDYLYITGNPYADLNTINKNYDYQTLVIDGSNSTKLIELLEQQAKEKHINYSVLKRNISLIAVSN